MKKLLLIVVLALGLIGCGSKPEYIQGQESGFNNDIIYFKDTRTNICFSQGQDSRSRTTVPCTPEVEALITKTPKYCPKCT